jgi:hypothetical protein
VEDILAFLCCVVWTVDGFLVARCHTTECVVWVDCLLWLVLVTIEKHSDGGEAVLLYT